VPALGVTGGETGVPAGRAGLPHAGRGEPAEAGAGDDNRDEGEFDGAHGCVPSVAVNVGS
jgi:hypothetical protein